MKKISTKKTLTLKKETITNLETAELAKIRGGSMLCSDNGSTMPYIHCPTIK